MKQQEEDRLFIDQVHNDLIQERNNLAMKKQSQIDQSQRDYISFMSQRQANPQSNQGTSLRKKNSKLLELNTFKIGGEVREIKKKSNYQDYNESLNLNPTKNFTMPLTSQGSQIQSGVGKNTPSYNIISNIISNDYVEPPLYHASNEVKTKMNRDNFDQYGRQIGNKTLEIKGTSNANANSIQGIENLENFSPYHDHYNYRPPSGTKSTYNQTQGYVHDKNGCKNNQTLKNEYAEYRQSPIQQQEYRQAPIQQPEYPDYRQAPIQQKPSRGKVDLNSIPIPETVTNVEEYEQYLHSIGINPQTLEYKSDSVSDLEQNFSKMGISNQTSVNPYGDNVPQNQNNYQISNQGQNSSNQPQNSNIRKNAKNQSNIQLSDQVSNTNKKEEPPKKEYFPLNKSKQVMSNPCKTIKITHI